VTGRRPLLLDAFCGAGGAAMGYHRAGFDVIGVDVKAQPRYPFPFVRGDAVVFIRQMGWMFDAVHASPPCHDFTSLRSRAGLNGTGWLLSATREALEATGRPWVIENVPDAPMRADVTLCGSVFDLGTDGMTLKRHRRFESNVPITGAGPDRCAGRRIGGVYGGGPTSGVTRRKLSAPEARRAMGIGWMTRDELSQAIPPAYTEHLGRQLLEAVTGGSQR